MSRLNAVKALIERHRDLAMQYNELAQYHLQLSKEYEAYKYELTKPGFATKGWKRFSKQSRIENYVVQAEHDAIIKGSASDF